MGRPSTFSNAIAEAICERIAAGDSLRTICADDSMPAQSTVFKWLAEKSNASFSEQYASARGAQMEAMAEEILAIADDSSNDTMTVQRGDDEKEIANNEWINRSRLRVDTRKWLMSKLAPKKYGEKIDVTGDLKVTRIVVHDDAPAAIVIPLPKPEFDDDAA